MSINWMFWEPLG